MILVLIRNTLNRSITYHSVRWRQISYTQHVIFVKHFCKSTWRPPSFSDTNIRQESSKFGKLSLQCQKINFSVYTLYYTSCSLVDFFVFSLLFCRIQQSQVIHDFYLGYCLQGVACHFLIIQYNFKDPPIHNILPLFPLYSSEFSCFCVLY